MQLINKTNQFNLTTRRRNQAELEAFLAGRGAHGFRVRLADRFADHGLIAVALAEVRADGRLEIDTLLMSCRVLGRGVETLVAGRARPARRRGRLHRGDRELLPADRAQRHGGRPLSRGTASPPPGRGRRRDPLVAPPRGLDSPGRAHPSDLGVSESQQGVTGVSDVTDRLTEVFRVTFGDETIVLDPAMTADDIEGWDSVSHITLIYAIEDEFGIKFSTRDLEGLDLRRRSHRRSCGGAT